MIRGTSDLLQIARQSRVSISALALLCGIAGLITPTARAEVLIERIFMPHDASPSSFAIGLPGGINFCFDPVRGGVSYAWKGGFLDLTPARPGTGKFINPVKLLGPLGNVRTKPDLPSSTCSPDSTEYR